MKPLTINDAQTMILGLQDEIRRGSESRYDHRLHCVLLVAKGYTCPQVASLFGDAPRSVEGWVRSFERDGFAGLIEGERSGRPPRLNEAQLKEIDAALRNTPVTAGMTGHLWDGKTLSAYIKHKYGIHLGVRQSQRLFKHLDFRLRKPRPLLAHADPIAQEAHKKTQSVGS